jgi:hypothetical protein
LSFVDAKDTERKRKSGEDEAEGSEMRASRKKRAPADDVGRALRSAYDEAVGESIPPEMLDLLGKLG